MDQASRKKLRAITTGPVLFDEPLDRYTSMQVGGRADALVFPQSVEELGKLVLFFKESDHPFLVVGNWTNLLVRDGGYRGVIIAMKDLCRVTWGQEDQDHVMVDAQAGFSDGTGPYDGRAGARGHGFLCRYSGKRRGSGHHECRRLWV
jgi:UDP-N-acetylmuramate dehydrogenase